MCWEWWLARGVGGGSSIAISDISTYSRSSILLATLGCRAAAGLYGPLAERLGAEPGSGAGKSSPDSELADEATDASRCRPVPLPLQV